MAVTKHKWLFGSALVLALGLDLGAARPLWAANQNQNQRPLLQQQDPQDGEDDLLGGEDDAEAPEPQPPAAPEKAPEPSPEKAPETAPDKAPAPASEKTPDNSQRIGVVTLWDGTVHKGRIEDRGGSVVVFTAAGAIELEKSSVQSLGYEAAPPGEVTPAPTPKPTTPKAPVAETPKNPEPPAPELEQPEEPEAPATPAPEAPKPTEKPAPKPPANTGPAPAIAGVTGVVTTFDGRTLRGIITDRGGSLEVLTSDGPVEVEKSQVASISKEGTPPPLSQPEPEAPAPETPAPAPETPAPAPDTPAPAPETPAPAPETPAPAPETPAPAPETPAPAPETPAPKSPEAPAPEAPAPEAPKTPENPEPLPPVEKPLEPLAPEETPDLTRPEDPEITPPEEKPADIVPPNDTGAEPVSPDSLPAKAPFGDRIAIVDTNGGETIKGRLRDSGSSLEVLGQDGSIRAVDKANVKQVSYEGAVPATPAPTPQPETPAPKPETPAPRPETPPETTPLTTPGAEAKGPDAFKDPLDSKPEAKPDPTPVQPDPTPAQPDPTPTPGPELKPGGPTVLPPVGGDLRPDGTPAPTPASTPESSPETPTAPDPVTPAPETTAGKGDLEPDSSDNLTEDQADKALYSDKPLTYAEKIDREVEEFGPIDLSYRGSFEFTLGFIGMFTDGGTSKRLEEAPGLNLRALYNFDKSADLALELSLNYVRARYRVTTFANNSFADNASFTTLDLNVVLRPAKLRFDFATPYLSIGPSLLFVTGINNVDPGRETDIGANIEAGLDYKLSRDISLKLAFRARAVYGRFLRGRDASDGDRIRFFYEPTLGVVFHFG